MFHLIKVGDTAVVDGKVYEVVRVSPSRFWLQIDGQPVKFTKKNGIEYGAGRSRMARPAEEMPATQQRKVARRVAIGDLPEPEFAWLLAVDVLLKPESSVMDALRAGWDWRPHYPAETPATAFESAVLFVR